MAYIDLLHEQSELANALLELFLADELVGSQQQLVVFLLLGELGLLHAVFGALAFACAGVFVAIVRFQIGIMAHSCNNIIRRNYHWLTFYRSIHPK